MTETWSCCAQSRDCFPCTGHLHFVRLMGRTVSPLLRLKGLEATTFWGIQAAVKVQFQSEAVVEGKKRKQNCLVSNNTRFRLPRQTFSKQNRFRWRPSQRAPLTTSRKVFTNGEAKIETRFLITAAHNFSICFYSRCKILSRKCVFVISKFVLLKDRETMKIMIGLQSPHLCIRLWLISFPIWYGVSHCFLSCPSRVVSRDPSTRIAKPSSFWCLYCLRPSSKSLGVDFSYTEVIGYGSDYNEQNDSSVKFGKIFFSFQLFFEYVLYSEFPLASLHRVSQRFGREATQVTSAFEREPEWSKSILHRCFLDGTRRDHWT